jgi:replication initiator protein RepSA
VTLDHRVCEVELEGLNVPAHVAELVRACMELGGHPSLAKLRLRKWAHMLGFGGHFSSKSRRYSTTLGALRRARVAYAIAGVAVTACRWTPGGGPRTTRR